MPALILRSQRVAELARRFPRSKAEVFSDLEQDRAFSTGTARGFALPDLAKGAFTAGEFSKAQAYVNEMLRADPKSGNYGALVHDGYAVRGLLALQAGNVEQAKQDLLLAGTATSTPVLMSFGPDMTLAKALTEKGERETVLEYFARCKVFWQMGQEKLDRWSAALRAGKSPDFGPGLN
jgi:hypothetical protein